MVVDKSYKIARLDSHSALQILKGAKDEGFSTICVCLKGREKVYKEFNVADILQLIFFQKKTGILNMVGKVDRFRILFFDGNVVGAESKARGFEKRLLWILLRREVISQEIVEHIIVVLPVPGEQCYGKDSHVPGLSGPCV